MRWENNDEILILNVGQFISDVSYFFMVYIYSTDFI